MNRSELGGLAIGLSTSGVIVLWAIVTSPIGPVAMFGGAVVLACVGLLGAGIFGLGCLDEPRADPDDELIEGRVVVIDPDDE